MVLSQVRPFNFRFSKKQTTIESTSKVIFKQILQAIEYMHEKGVCHRDLKPHNILLTTHEKCVKITDFNVSKYFKTTLGEHKELIKMTTHTGTMAFSAPETFTNEEYTYGVFLRPWEEQENLLFTQR